MTPRPLTHTDRANIAALYALGVFVELGHTARGAFRQRVTVRGNSYPVRELLRNAGFAWSARYRTWTAYGDLDIATLLPRMLAEHHAHERAAESQRCEVTREMAELVLAGLRLPAPSPVPADVLAIEDGRAVLPRYLDADGEALGFEPSATSEVATIPCKAVA